jgi:acetolactate synthase-1/3 small subunit
MISHTISVLVENNFGVLTRISGLFASRGYNIQSLTVGPTETTSLSRMTIVVDGDDRVIVQVKKQLNKLIEVIDVEELTGGDYIERELALIKVNAKVSERAEIFQIADVFEATIVDISHSMLSLEVIGKTKKIDAIIELLRPFSLQTVARTGKIALTRG